MSRGMRWAVIASILLWIVAIGQSDAASHDVWLISTHGACDGCSIALESQPLQFWRLESECQWRRRRSAGAAAHRRPSRADRDLHSRL